MHEGLLSLHNIKERSTVTQGVTNKIKAAFENGDIANDLAEVNEGWVLSSWEGEEVRQGHWIVLFVIFECDGLRHFLLIPNYYFGK